MGNWISLSDRTNFGSVFLYGARYEIRTRVPAVKGRCPRPLDELSIVLYENTLRILYQTELSITVYPAEECLHIEPCNLNRVYTKIKF